MARSEIPMVINLRQNKNAESAAYGKYFAEVDSKEPLNLKGFAAHMTSHGKIADYQMCVLVLGQVVDCVTPGSGHFVTVTDSPDPTVTMADKMIERMKSYKPVWEAIIDQSFLPEQMKTSYFHLLNKRIELL